MTKTSVTVTKVVGALAVVLTTFPATAAIITDEVSFNESLANDVGIDEDFLLDLFDPLLGTLQSVSLAFVTSLTNQSISMSATCSNQAPCNIRSERTVRTQDQFHWELGSSVTPLFGTVDLSPDVSCSGVGACDGAAPLPDVRNTYDLFFDIPADLALFQGPGAFPLNYQLSHRCPGTTFGGGSAVVGSCTYNGDLSMAATVAYNYIEAAPEPEPPVAVPEPGALTLLGLGLAAVGFTRRLRVRC